MSKTKIDKMVDRFLGWMLPKDFAPDAGISFSPTNPDGHGTPWWPVGTNLLTADQARQMFEYVTAEERSEDDLVVEVLTVVAKDLVSEQPRHDKESLFRTLNRLFPNATADEIDAAISEAL